MMPVTVVDLGVRLSAPDSFIKQPKHSAFFITINTNKGDTVCNARLLAHELHNILKELFSTIENIASILTFHNAGDTYEKIVKTDVEFVVEKGQDPRGGRVHAHVLIQFKHFTSIHINKYALEEYVIRNIHTCPLDSVYINIKSVGYAANLRSYFTKYTKDALKSGK